MIGGILLAIYSTEIFHNNVNMLRDEWLITNGLGSYASSTIAGINTRKYHGLLISSFNPPVDRRLMVSKLDEKIIFSGNKYDLATNLINDLSLEERKANINEIKAAAFNINKDAVMKTNIKSQGEGYKYLLCFENEPFPTFTYLIKGIMIQKSIYMPYQKNTTVVKYKVLEAKENTKLELIPLLNYRSHHEESLLTNLKINIIHSSDHFLKIDMDNHQLNIYWTEGKFQKKEGYFMGMYYPFETYRGETNLDDHYIPGSITVDISKNKEFVFVFSTEDINTLDYQSWENNLICRQKDLLHKYAKTNNDFINKLILAADSFIVDRKSTNKKTILAGYPWFTDWGRDTMISLPGLTLATGRYEEAKEILSTFAVNLKDGLIPNVFDDYSGEAAHYNTVDATLWFFYAIKRYLDYTKDIDFIMEIYPKLEEIIEHHKKGTKYNIKMDPNDGLLIAGDKGIQLTWMDAKAGDWVVTPRYGKAVEINALWYNALKIFNELSNKLAKPESNLDIITSIEENFPVKFWYKDGQYLYDVINEDKPDRSLRPNQVFVVSLPYSLLDHEKEKAVIYKVYKELYTPVGLRSLAPSDENYIGTYGGKRIIRDGAYHQGTAWAWLIGAFFEGYLKVNNYSPEAKNRVINMYKPFIEHLNHYGLGNISEIFDGDFPHEPRGCSAQAWSVAELLRIYYEYLS